MFFINLRHQYRKLTKILCRLSRPLCCQYKQKQHQQKVRNRTSNLPQESTVIVESGGGNAVCGSFSLAEMTFKISEIAKIVFEGAGRNVDVIRLKVGDKISGVVQDEKVAYQTCFRHEY